MPEAQAVAPQIEQPRMSEVRRLFGVFWEPGNAFADIVRRPRWWVPMVIAIAAALVYTYLIAHRIGWEQIVREGMATSGQAENMSAADRERAVEMGAKVWGIAGYAMAVVGTPVSMLLIAGVLTLFFTVFLGSRTKFRDVFGVVAYAHLLNLIVIGAMSLVLFLKPAEDYDINNPVGLNVGFYLPHEWPKWLTSLGSSIDVMSFWMIALLAIGLRAADPKAPRSRAAAAVLLPWGLYVFGKLVIAAIRG